MGATRTISEAQKIHLGSSLYFHVYYSKLMENCHHHHHKAGHSRTLQKSKFCSLHQVENPGQMKGWLGQKYWMGSERRKPEVPPTALWPITAIRNIGAFHIFPLFIVYVMLTIFFFPLFPIFILYIICWMWTLQGSL